MTVAVIEKPQLRGKALARWREQAAVHLAAQGCSYDAIAEAVGYANRGTAWRVVQEALARQVAEHVDDLRRLEAARLDALQAAFWEKALGGDVKAADRVLRVIAQRIRLFGLEKQPQPAAEEAPPGQTFFLLEGGDRLSNLRFNAIARAELAGKRVFESHYEEAGLKPGEAAEMVREQLILE